MRNKRISILGSCYNMERFVKQAINSVLNQTYKNFQLHIFDNNSTDNSLNVIYDCTKHLLEKNKIFVHPAVWKGTTPIGEFRYYQIMFETGCDYCAMLDLDDFWTPTKLEKQIKLFDEPGVKMVYSDCSYYHWQPGVEQVPDYPVFIDGKAYSQLDKETFHQKHPRIIDMPTFYGMLLRYNFMPTVTTMFEVKSLRSVSMGEDLSCCEDYNRALKMSLNYKTAYVPEPLAVYRIHSNQITTRTSAACTAEEIRVVKSYRNKIKSKYVWKYRWHIFVLWMKFIYKKVMR